MGRETRVRYEGRDYVIPDMWLTGFQLSTGCTLLEAVAWWAYQDELARAEAV